MKGVDLTLIKKQVAELETQLAIVDQRKSEGCDPHTLTVEVNKAMGLAMGVSTEATGLVGDMVRSLQSSTLSKEDALTKLLGSLGGGGLPGSN